MELKKDIKRVFRYSKLIALGSAVLVVIIYLLSGFYSVKPEQCGVVRRFGEIINDGIPPGIHYHWPWPFEAVARPKTTEIRSLNIRFHDTTNTDWSDSGGALLTGDENLVLATVILQYNIKQPKEYLTTTADSEEMLRRIVFSSNISRFTEMTIDEVLTTGRQEIQIKLKRDIQEIADAYHLGVRITSLQIQRIEPPAAVARAFKDVASAREDKEKAIRKAEGERNRRLPGARADANDMTTKAEAYAREVVDMSRGDAERFLSTWSEYRKARSITAHRLYMEAIEEILPRTRKMIASPDAERNIPAGRFLR